MVTTEDFDGARTAVVDGTTLAYLELGEGEPVVFVHGDISDLRTWEQQMAPVSLGHRVIAYSRRFFRPNEEGTEGADYAWIRHVDDLLLFLDTTKAAPAHLVGNSSGAYIALLAALRQPDVVRTLVLEEPPVMPLLMTTPPRPADMLKLLARSPRAALSMMNYGMTVMIPAEKAFRRGDDDKGMKTFARGVLGGREFFDRLSPARLRQMKDNVTPIKQHLLTGVLPALADEDLRRMTVPTLIITGERTAPSMNRLMDRLQELLPNVERVAVPNASHFMHEDNALAVNKAILDFLARHSS